MDVLAEVMRLLRIQGQLYGRLEFTAPWGFEFPGDKGICLMCENRSLALAAIAAAVGYGSESAFGKVFRPVIGVSPGQYRRDHQRDAKQTG